LGLFGGVVFIIIEAVLLTIVHSLVAVRVCHQHHVGLFDADGAIHTRVFQRDAGFRVPADDYVFRLGALYGIRFHAELGPKHVGGLEGFGNQRHGKSAIVDAVGELVWIRHVSQFVYAISILFEYL
jgi:hypothetical protein